MYVGAASRLRRTVVSTTKVFVGRVGMLTFLGGRGGNSLGKAWVIIQIQRGTGPIRCVSRHAFAEKEMQRSRDMTGPPSN